MFYFIIKRIVGVCSLGRRIQPLGEIVVSPAFRFAVTLDERTLSSERAALRKLPRPPLLHSKIFIRRKNKYENAQNHCSAVCCADAVNAALADWTQVTVG